MDEFVACSFCIVPLGTVVSVVVSDWCENSFVDVAKILFDTFSPLMLLPVVLNCWLCINVAIVLVSLMFPLNSFTSVVSISIVECSFMFSKVNDSVTNVWNSSGNVWVHPSVRHNSNVTILNTAIVDALMARCHLYDSRINTTMDLVVSTMRYWVQISQHSSWLMHYSSFSSIDTSDSQICYNGQNFSSVLMVFFHWKIPLGNFKSWYFHNWWLPNQLGI